MPEFGLCARCLHRRTIRSERGSVFVLCRLSESDPAWPRYPRLPVVACAGFVERTGAEPPEEEESE